MATARKHMERSRRSYRQRPFAYHENTKIMNRAFKGWSKPFGSSFLKNLLGTIGKFGF